ncbi:MAG: dephospho-CoA kinase [Pseudomonadota bacterium]
MVSLPFFTVGLTGGIASGKSVVSDALAQRGANIVDTDVLAREVVAPETDGHAAVVSAFGKAIVQDDGELDRGALRRLVFADSQQRKTLESIVHPRIGALALQRLNEPAKDAYHVLVVPLMAGSAMRQWVHRIVSVECVAETQMRRLLSRDGADIQTANGVIAAQADNQTRRRLADDIVNNDGSLQQLLGHAERLHRLYFVTSRQFQASNH